MSDSVDFDREVSQEVLSTPFVSVPDGAYELRLKFRERGKWDVLKVAVEPNGNQTFLDLKRLKSNDQRTEAVLGTRIEGGKARIVFRGRGRAMAQCLVDDVTLTKK